MKAFVKYSFQKNRPVITSLSAKFPGTKDVILSPFSVRVLRSMPAGAAAVEAWDKAQAAWAALSDTRHAA